MTIIRAMSAWIVLATHGRRFNLADAGSFGDRAYFRDVGEGIVKLLVGRFEYRRLWRYRKVKVVLGAIAGHVVSNGTMSPAVTPRVRSGDRGYFQRCSTDWLLPGTYARMYVRTYACTHARTLNSRARNPR